MKSLLTWTLLVASLLLCLTPVHRSAMAAVEPLQKAIEYRNQGNLRAAVIEFNQVPSATPVA